MRSILRQSNYQATSAGISFCRGRTCFCRASNDRIDFGELIAEAIDLEIEAGVAGNSFVKSFSFVALVSCRTKRSAW
jgi:hypothetical protein